jgi:hypothetical protein
MIRPGFLFNRPAPGHDGEKNSGKDRAKIVFRPENFPAKKSKPEVLKKILALFEFGKTYRTFVPPLGNHGEIMEIFLEMLVFREREDDGDLVPVLIDNILFGGGHTGFLIIHCIRLMI